MKTPRERIMTFIALAMITLTLGGVLFFMYYDRNMSALKNRQRNIQTDLDRDGFTLAEIQKALPGLKLAKRVSLPADADQSKRDYEQELGKMLRSSGFLPVRTSLSFKQQDNRASVIASKRPPFTRLSFDIQTHGDLSMLVDFFDRFYRKPLLHRIKGLTVSRPITTTRDSIPGELDIIVNVEALIVDGAESRKTLLPEGLKEVDLPKRLARTDDQYASIAGNNIFFGPPPKDSVNSPDPSTIKDFEILPETWLNMIDINEKGIVATIWDSANEYMYQIRRRYDGTFKVDKYYFNKENIRKPLEVGEERLNLKDTNGYLHRSFKVVRIDPTDVLLEDAGKFYRLHMGMAISDLKPMSASEMAKFHISAPDEKKDDKSSGKAEDKKTGKGGAASSAMKTTEGR